MPETKTIVSLAAAYAVTLGLIRWVLLQKRRQPAATVAWILTIVLLPYLGGVLFLFFGINRVQRRAATKHAATLNLAARLPSLDAYELSAVSPLNGRQMRLMHIARRACGTMPTAGNSIELLTDTNVTLRRIEEAIEAARESVHLEYYIWQPDKTGTRMRDLLIRKAEQGVAVRFLYDGLGSMWLTRRFLWPMRKAGIAVATFLPGQSLRERWSMNLRSHRKIVVIDGETGFTGGMNIGDEYLGRNKVMGHWRDTHLQLRGPTVLQLQHVFAEDWYYATGEEVTQPYRFPAPSAAGSHIAQVVSGGPDEVMRTFHSLMFAAINEARERITLATSYFVPTEALAMALETAACRGVQVRLMLAGKAAYKLTVLAGRSYYEALLRAGVEIHEYRRGIQHAKTLTIDGIWSLVGSPNFDARSLLLNFEVAVALYDHDLASQLEQQFEIDAQHARRIDGEEWKRRPLRHVFIENACRLLSPVL